MYDPKPDIVYRPSQVARESEAARRPRQRNRRRRVLALPPTTENVRMSIKEVFVIDNRDPGVGDIYLVTVVTDGASVEPITTSVKTFQDVRDGSALPLGPAGLPIYRNTPGKVPRFIDYRLLVAESDEGLREAGAVLDDIRKDSEYGQVRDNLRAIATASQPVAGLVVSAADLVIGIVSRVLRMNKDDQLIYVAGGFDDAFDDLGVKHGVVVHANAFVRLTYQVEAA
jgi:hypothetical protein